MQSSTAPTTTSSRRWQKKTTKSARLGRRRSRNASHSSRTGRNALARKSSATSVVPALRFSKHTVRRSARLVVVVSSKSPPRQPASTTQNLSTARTRSLLST